MGLNHFFLKFLKGLKTTPLELLSDYPKIDNSPNIYSEILQSSVIKFSAYELYETIILYYSNKLIHI